MEAEKIKRDMESLLVWKSNQEQFSPSLTTALMGSLLWLVQILWILFFQNRHRQTQRHTGIGKQTQT